MVDVDGAGEGSGPRSGDMVRFRCLVTCTWRITLLLGLGPSSDVGESVKLSFRFMGKQG